MYLSYLSNLSIQLSSSLSIYLCQSLPSSVSIFSLALYIYISLSLCLLPGALLLSLPPSLSLSIPLYLSLYLPLSLSISFYRALALSLPRALSLSLFLSFSFSSFSLSLSPSRSPSPSFSLSLYLFRYLSMNLSIFLSGGKQLCAARFKSGSWQVQKEAFLQDFLKKRSSEPQNEEILRGFLNFRLGNVENEAILRDFLQNWNAGCRADGLVPMRLAIFMPHLSKVPRLPRKSESAAPVTQNDLRKPEDRTLRSATPLESWKSTPWPPNSPNISGERTPIDILPRSVPSRNCHETPRFCSLLARYTIHCACHETWRPNVRKCSKHVMFLAFCLRHVLRAAALPRALRFDFEIFFAPQPRVFYDPPSDQIALHLPC